jgi:hypothetical protein
MARKKRKLCWDDVADLDSRTLQGWQAFRPGTCESIDIEGEGIDESPTFIMDDAGKSFTLVYVWHDGSDDVTTCRVRVLLDEIPRGLGKEIVFQCPSCDRRCTRLAFRSYGLVCAKCGPVTWGSNREGKVARMVRRANTIADKLGLQSWSQRPMRKPGHMRLARYVSLLDQRQRVVAQIAKQLHSRRRITGNNLMHMGDLYSATSTGSEVE